MSNAIKRYKETVKSLDHLSRFAHDIPVTASRDFDLKLLWLYAMIASYFYCLPVARLSHVALTDLRIYDVVFAFGFLLFIMPNLRLLVQTIRQYEWLRAYFQFAAWAAMTLLVVAILSGLDRALIATGRLVRFIAYGLVHAAVLAFVRDRTVLRRMAYLFLTLIVVESLISFFQTRGIVGQLWPEYWLRGSYGSLPVGTLGPHHLHLGSLAVVGVALGLALLGLPDNFLLKAFVASTIGFVAYAAFSVGSRSAYVGFGIVVFGYLFLRDRRIPYSRLGTILWLMVGLGMFLYWGRQEVIASAEQAWELGVWSPYQRGGLPALSPARVKIWLRALQSFVHHPWILVTGAGIQNAEAVIRIDTAAHNNYLHVLVETGVPGLYLYLKALLLMHKRARWVYQNARCPFGRSLALGFGMGFVAILLLNLFNENFYMQYSLFSFTGQIMALAAMAVHPLWETAGYDLPTAYPSPRGRAGVGERRVLRNGP